MAVSLQTVLTGIETTQFREADEVIPVTLRSVAADRQDLGKLETLNIYSQTTGRAVPISQVAETRIVWEPSKILRRDRLKTVTVEASLVSGLTATEVNAERAASVEAALAARFDGAGSAEGVAPRVSSSLLA